MPSVLHDLYSMELVVVDDSEANVALLKQLLLAWGFRNVTGITDAVAAVGYCKTRKPDMLLLDLHMPGLSGLDVLHELTEDIHDVISLPVLVLTGSAIPDAKNRALEAGARDFLTKPLDIDEVKARVCNNLELRRLQLAQRDHEQALEERVAERTSELHAARIETLQRLARAGEFRDDQTGDHARRVGETSRQLAVAIGCSPAFAADIEVAAPLHDIGKIAVPDAILLKPGSLDPGEIAVMQAHTTHGAELLTNSSSSLLELAREIALTHHERWDGTGYPYGLSGTGIPLAGRIVAIADVFDALTHDRPYKPAWSVDRAVDEVIAQAGGHFDPDLAAAFARLDPASLV